MIAIREDDSMKCRDLFEFTSHSSEVDDRSIEEIPRYYDDFPAEGIDFFYQFSRIVGIIDISIVSICDHDDFFAMPGMWSLYIYRVVYHSRDEARIQRPDVDPECEYDESDEVSDMMIGDPSQSREDKEGYGYESWDRDAPEPDGAVLVECGRKNIRCTIGSYKTYDKRQNSYQSYDHHEGAVSREERKESYDNSEHHIAPSECHTRESREKYQYLVRHKESKNTITEPSIWFHPLSQLKIYIL